VLTAPVGALLLLRGALDDVRTWARGGLLPTWLVPYSSWTLVVPAGPPSAAPPYDDPVALLGGRPTPSRLRPSLCLVADGPRAVAVVQERGRRAPLRWLVWSQGVGPTSTPDLPGASVALVAELAGVGTARGAAVLQDALAADARAGCDVVDDVLRALSLPGAGLPLGAVRAEDLPGAERVEPDAAAVARFDSFARTDAELAVRGDVRRGDDR
jgi:hypothetical protein